METDPNERIRSSLIGLENLSVKDNFEKPSMPEGEGVPGFPPKQSVDLVNDISLISDVEKILFITENRQVHYWCCFIFNRLLANTKTDDVSNFLIDTIKNEKEVWKLKNLVMPMAVRNPNTNRVTELLYLLEHKNQKVKYDVVRALQHCTDSIIEKPLLNVLESSQKEYDLLFTLQALGGVTTEKSLDSLYPLLYHKKQKIKIYSLGVIASIQKSEGSEFYIDLLADKNYRDKNIVTVYIRRHCGTRGIRPICNRIKTILNQKRGHSLKFRCGDNSIKTELVLNVLFLKPYYDKDAHIEKTFQLIEKKWGNVLEDEKEEILDAIQTPRNVAIKP